MHSSAGSISEMLCGLGYVIWPLCLSFCISRMELLTCLPGVGRSGFGEKQPLLFVYNNLAICTFSRLSWT